jgi:ligand-binding sensor domain-containing protein/DNA-binding CsgD family transcriptional regulator
MMAVCAGLAAATSLRAHSFTPVGVTNGLEARVVSSLEVDKDGFLWIGSREGLFRFDGYETLGFHPDPDNPSSISEDNVSVVFEDSHGVIWVGTDTGGLNRYNGTNGDFEHFRHDSADPATLIENGILDLSDGPDGGLWVATRSGLSRLDPGSGRFEHFRHHPAEAGSVSANWIQSLHHGVSGSLWVGTIGGGVNRWDPVTRSFLRFDLAALTGGEAESNDVFAMYEDPDGLLWIGTRVGLLVLDPAAATARDLQLDWNSQFLPLITSMIGDEGGRLWLGTLAHGVLIVDRRTGDWDASSGGPRGSADHLRDQPQTSLARSQDMVFVGTWGGGVYRTMGHSTGFDLLGEQGIEGLSEKNVTAVIAGGEPGRPWIGTQGAGPQRITIATRRMDGLGGLPDDIRQANVLTLARAPEGDYLAGTGIGLFRLSPSGELVDLIAHDPKNPDGIGEGAIRALLTDTGRGLWIGTEGSGLYLLESGSGGGLVRHHRGEAPDSISGDSVTALLTGRKGHIWVGTRADGLNHCTIEPWSCEQYSGRTESTGGLSHHYVTALFRGRDGHVWVATGKGLNRVLRDDAGQVSGFQHWDSGDGLLEDAIMAIQQDLDGSLWLSTRRGLTRFHPATGRVVNYVPEAGLPARHFNTGAAAADASHIYFGSMTGLLAIGKGSAFTGRSPSPVRIASIDRAERGGRQFAAFWPEDRLAIPYREVLSIKLATLDMSEFPHEYGYRLGAEEPWTSMGPQRQLILHGLSPGTYSFQAHGRDVFGMWGESVPLELEIVPPWWMTNWFRGLVLVAVLLIALMLHRVREATLKRRAREIQRLSEKREQALERKLGSEAELAVLTPRQKEVLQLIAEGQSTRQIAEVLGVSIKTVEAHRANLMDRLEIHDVPGLVRLAIRAHLVSQYE